MYMHIAELLNPKTGVFASSKLLQTFICILTFYVTIKVWIHKRQRTTRLVEQFPGLQKFPILGSAFTQFTFKVGPNPAKYLMEEMEKLSKTKGKVFKWWQYSSPKIGVADAELAIRLYNEGHLQGKSTEVTDTAKAVGGEGLLALSAESHPLRRKQWMPSFTRKQVEYSVQFFREQALWLCDQLKVHEDKGTDFDFLNLSIETTFRAICYSAFGEHYMAQLPESVGRDHMHDLHTVSVHMSNRVFQPWNANDFLYFNVSPAGREVMRCVKRAKLLSKQALDHRQSYRKVTSALPKSSEEFECFIDHLLGLLENGQLTESEVIQELDVFIAAGYDTTGITISFVLYFLSLYPEYQDKVVDELCDVFPHKNWNNLKDLTMTPVQIKEMKYLELCIKEAMRLYPTLPISPRKTTHDVKLPDGKVIPANVDVFVMLYIIHRDPEYFPEPDQFLPERHINPSYGGAFMPFTLGARNCIGQVYAMFEMKVILAYLLMSYKWTLLEKPGLKTSYQVLQVPTELKFRIEPRV